MARSRSQYTSQKERRKQYFCLKDHLQLWRIGISVIQIDCLHESEDHKILNVSILWAMTHILGLSRELHDSSHVL